MRFFDKVRRWWGLLGEIDGLKAAPESVRHYANIRINTLHERVVEYHKEVEEIEQNLKREIAALGCGETNSTNVFRIIEDLRARMPKGSAVSDHRHDEDVRKLCRENELLCGLIDDLSVRVKAIEAKPKPKPRKKVRK